MDFFKSVLSEDPPPPDPDSSENPVSRGLPADAPVPTDTGSSGGAWSFGSLIKTLATKSESVIQNYRRDLEEFKSGLRKETDVIREAASRAVKDLPASLEVGASVAQESLESVGQAIDDIGATVWKSTAVVISHSKEVLRDLDSDSADYTNSGNNKGSRSQLYSYSPQGLEANKYSRFDAQMRAIQGDVGTYCDEPSDKEDCMEWRSGFLLEEKSGEIESLVRENGVIEEIYGKVVPGTVDHETFWVRYFYRVHKLRQAEDARARLVKLATSGEEDEDLRWDFDDDEEEEGEGSASNPENGKFGSAAEGSGQVVGKEKEQNSVPETENSGGAEEEVHEEPNDNKSEGKIQEKEKPESGDSDVSIVSSQPSTPEEDLGWDEIEDIVSNDESKGNGASSSTSRVDPRQRLSAAEEEEDLSWDIEEDDEPPKAQ